MLTIEGLSRNDVLDPLQEAFMRNIGAQCGFCTPGQIMSAKALLLANPSPTRQQITEWLSGNICRCGAYPAIVASVQEAAAELAEIEALVIENYQGQTHCSVSNVEISMLLIDNDTATQVLNMADCITALEEAYKEEALGSATNRTKSQMHVHTDDPDKWYRFSSAEGGLAHAGVVAIRIKSDVLSWPTMFGKVRAYNYCMEPDRYCGLVLLFKTDNGEPLAILNDGVMQHLRVGQPPLSRPNTWPDKTPRCWEFLDPAEWRSRTCKPTPR